MTAEVVPPEFASTEILRLMPGDVIVVRVAQLISPEIAQRLREALEARFEGHHVVVLGDGMRLQILRES